MQISSRFTIAVHIFACIKTFENDYKIMQISSRFTLAVHLFMCSRIWIAKFIRLCLDKRNYHNIVIPYSL